MFHPDGPTFRELAHQALSSTQRGYDLLAPKFDRTPFRTPEPVVAALRDHLWQGPPVRTAVDLCCGTGAVVEVLSSVVTEEVTGVDFSAGMLARAAANVTSGPRSPRIRFEHRDVLDGPAAGESYDLATCFGALGHIPYGQERAWLDSVRAMVVPGGRFVFPSGPPPPLVSRPYWFGRAFNAAMHVRNALVHPPFTMFYLRFLLPEAVCWLEVGGWDVRLIPGRFPPPFDQHVLVEGTRR